MLLHLIVYVLHIYKVFQYIKIAYFCNIVTKVNICFVKIIYFVWKIFKIHVYVNIADIGNNGNLNTFLDSMHKYTNGTTAQPNGDKTHPNQLGYEKFYLPIIYNVLTTI